MFVCVMHMSSKCFLVFIAPRVFVCNVLADGIEACWCCMALMDGREVGWWCLLSMKRTRVDAASRCFRSMLDAVDGREAG